MSDPSNLLKLDTSSLSPVDTIGTDKQRFKRNYLACLNCRTRKVKCDLGNVDSPHDPPCARCKRERKECVFAESKRGGVKNSTSTKKRKVSGTAGDRPTPNIQQQQQHQQQPVVDHYQQSFQNHPLPRGSTQLPSINYLNTPHTVPATTTQEYKINDPLSHSTHLPMLPISINSLDTPSSLSLPPMKNSTLPRSNVPLPIPNLRSVEQPNPSVPSSTGTTLATEISNYANPTATTTSISTSTSNSLANIKALHDGSNPEAKTYSLSTSNSINPEQAKTNLTSNSTMIFLAHIAGNIAKADDRDRINAYEKIETLERKSSSQMGSSGKITPGNGNEVSSGSVSEVIDGTTAKLAETQDQNAQSAKTVRSNSQTSEHSASSTPYTKEKFGHETSLFPTIREDRFSMPPIRSTLNIRPKPSSTLSDIEYIGDNNILTESEARKLLKMFFVTMHPFFPYIPKELQDVDVIPGYPLLLCAILTISSRYHSLEDNNEEETEEDKAKDKASETAAKPPRHIEIHEQLWIYSQRLISMTVWGESSSRSVGTLLSFLLFTEWNPRAIHFRWSDYANNTEDEAVNNDDTYAGLSAMKRSEIMSFMLIGTATRLSFLLDDHPLMFLATHIAETTSAINLNKRSMLSQTLSEVDINDPIYNFNNYQCANIELLQFTNLCYESLYGQNPKFGNLDKYQNLAILDILSPILENWYKKYYKLLKHSTPHTVSNALNLVNEKEDWDPNYKPSKDLYMSIERESIILDYYYAKLYLYSLALSGDTSINSVNGSNNSNNNTNTGNNNNKKGRNLRMDELAKYSRYVELGYNAAKEVLAVMQRVSKLRLLKYMPVRWVTRVIKAVAFIVKCYLTLTTENNQQKQPIMSKDMGATNEILKLSVIPVEEIITLLQKTAICLRDAAPDELHLCTRYSTILMYLCSQFKSKINIKNKRVVDYEDEIKQRDQREEKEKQEREKMRIQQQQQQQQQRYQLYHQQAYPPTGSSQAQVYPSPAYQQPQQQSQQQPLQQQQQSASSTNFRVEDLAYMNQQLFDDYFTNSIPSETLFNWFSNSNNNNPGLDFVDQFTKEIELDLLNKGNLQNNFSNSSGSFGGEYQQQR